MGVRLRISSGEELTLESSRRGLGTKRYTRPLSALSKIIFMDIGSDVLANDIQCIAFVFDECFWLVDDDADGLQGLGMWLDEFNVQHLIQCAELDFLPYFWRSKCLLLPGIRPTRTVLPSSAYGSLALRLTEISISEVSRFPKDWYPLNTTSA